METRNQKLTTEQSLDLITEMIRQAQGNVKRNSSYLILWGLVVCVANIGMYVLMQMDYSRPYLIWLITVPAWLATIFISYNRRKNATAVSHLDRINAFLWFSYGIVIFTLVILGAKINYQLNPVILLVSAVPTFVSGTIIRFRPLIIGGVLFWAFGILCFMINGSWQYLVGAVAVTTGYLIPGFMLQRKPE